MDQEKVHFFPILFHKIKNFLGLFCGEQVISFFFFFDVVESELEDVYELAFVDFCGFVVRAMDADAGPRGIVDEVLGC